MLAHWAQAYVPEVGQLVIKISRVFCCLVGKVTICERPWSRRVSRNFIKTHDSESRGQEEAGRTRDEQVSYLHVAPL